MTDSRYRVIAAIMDDPLNLVCIKREIARRGKEVQYLSPPVPKKGGNVVFPTFRWLLRSGLPSEIQEEVDQDAEVFSDGVSWFVTLTWEGGTEMGPFTSKARAVAEAQSFFTNQGFTLLTSVPWSGEDALEWRMKD